MRRIAAVASFAVLLAGAGCKKRPPQVETVEDGNGPALSVVQLGHPSSAGQLVSGFYQVEQNSWRWTAGKFAVALQPPPRADQAGARLEFRFSIPDAIVTRLGPITLKASVEGTPLSPETYAKPGQQSYIRDVPAAALVLKPVKIAFALDKFLKAGEVEARELGVVANSVALVAGN